MKLLVLSINTVAIGGLEPPKRDPHLIYSQIPLPLGTNRHKARLFLTENLAENPYLS